VLFFLHTVYYISESLLSFVIGILVSSFLKVQQHLFFFATTSPWFCPHIAPTSKILQAPLMLVPNHSKFYFNPFKQRWRQRGEWEPAPRRKFRPPQPGSIKLYCKKRRRLWYCTHYSRTVGAVVYSGGVSDS